MAWLEVPGLFEVGVSVRMIPQEEAKGSDRIKWALFDLNIFIGAQVTTRLTNKVVEDEPVSVVNKPQKFRLTNVFNKLMITSKKPLRALRDAGYAFCIQLQLQILRKQAANLNYIFGKQIKVTWQHVTETKVSNLWITIWPDAIFPEEKIL